jgi:hypothetical protein
MSFFAIDSEADDFSVASDILIFIKYKLWLRINLSNKENYYALTLLFDVSNTFFFCKFVPQADCSARCEDIRYNLYRAKMDYHGVFISFQGITYRNHNLKGYEAFNKTTPNDFG